MEVLQQDFIQGFIRLTQTTYQRGWNERNGGNLSYRMTAQEVQAVSDFFDLSAPFEPVGTDVPDLAGETFVVTGSGKYFMNTALYPKETFGIIQIDQSGSQYRVVWGLEDTRPTSELPSHLMNHEVKKRNGGDHYRVILHAHPNNLVALTFVLPLDDKTFTRQLWEMETECPIVFPDGIGVVPWMVPGGREIAVETAKLMETFDAAVWAHHGLFCAGESFDATLGLMDTIEKAAEILVKVLSMGGKRQTITVPQFRALAEEFHVTLPERYLEDE